MRQSQLATAYQLAQAGFSADDIVKPTNTILVWSALSLLLGIAIGYTIGVPR